MADVNETLVKEAIRRAEEEAAKKPQEKDTDASDAEDQTAEETGNDTGADLKDTSSDAAAQEVESSADECEAEGSESGQDASKSGDDKNSKKSSVFGKKLKKDKKDEKIEELTQKVDELNDRHLRDLAEFENFRKRTEREKSQMFEVGAKSIIEKILPAIDSFERGLSGFSEEDRATPVAEGMEKIYKQLMDSLSDAGLTVIETVGQEFDPELHNAVMHEENEEFGENTVSEELQKGYKYRDSVVRHSMVKVAN